MTTHDLHQNNLVPTRGTNILDLVLHSKHLTVSSETGDDIFMSDHKSIRVHLSLGSPAKSNAIPRPVYNFKKADMYDLRRTLQCIPWNILHATDDCEEATSLFYDLVEATLVDIVPVIRQRRRLPPWFDGDARRALNAKERAFCWKKSNPSQRHQDLFKEARTHFK